jgi:hypothetical protein
LLNTVAEYEFKVEILTKKLVTETASSSEEIEEDVKSSLVDAICGD